MSDQPYSRNGNAALDETEAGEQNESEDEAWPGERESDDEGQALAENEQQQPRTITEKLGNAIEDLIPGDSDKDGH